MQLPVTSDFFAIVQYPVSSSYPKIFSFLWTVSHYNHVQSFAGALIIHVMNLSILERGPVKVVCVMHTTNALVIITIKNSISLLYAKYE
jgi:hypothetical protein